MENLFSRLIKYRPRHDQTSKENFITELFCGMLERVPELRDSILKYMLERLGKESLGIHKWDISTQNSIQVEGIKYPDITLKRENEILIIEHKVDSSPYDDQLENYYKYLDKNNGVGLILLTKIHSIDYPQEKYPNVPFAIIYWDDILKELEHHKPNLKNNSTEYEWELVSEFEKFLMEEGMALKKRFDRLDYETMKNMGLVIETMDLALSGKARGKIKEMLPNAVFPKTSVRFTQLRETQKYNDYAHLSNEEKKITISIGFWLNLFTEYASNDNANDIYFPDYWVSLDIEYDHKEFNKHYEWCRNFAKRYKDWKLYPEPVKGWASLYCSISMKNLETNNHVGEINDWWIDRLGELEEFLKDNKLDKNSIN